MINIYWEEKFQEKVLSKAYDYHSRNAVEVLINNEHTAVAKVSGSSLYTVIIEKDSEQVTAMDCSCPHADSGANCKHMAAVLYTINNVEKFTLHEDEPVFVKDDGEFDRFPDIMTREYMDEYKNEIKAIFHGRAKRGFVNYSAAGDLFFELDNFIEYEIVRLLSVNENNATFDLTKQIVLKLGNLSIDDSDGGLTYTLNLIQDVWNELLEKGNDKLTNKMFQWMMRERKPSEMGVTEDYIETFLFTNFKEEKYLQKKLNLVKDKLETIVPEEYTSYNRDYTLGAWALRYLELKIELEGSLNNSKNFIRENLHLPGIREFYTEKCIEQGRYDTAVALLEEGKISEVTFPGTVHQYSLQLKDLYRRLNDNLRYKNELWQLVLRDGELTIYDEVKSLYSAEEWPEKQDIIFRTLEERPYSGVDLLYRSERMYDKILNLAMKQNGMWMIEKYKKELAERFPEAVLAKYVENVEDMAYSASNRKRYWSVVTALKTIEKMPGGEPVAKEIAENWKETYKNRPAMMDELKRF